MKKLITLLCTLLYLFAIILSGCDAVQNGTDKNGASPTPKGGSVVVPLDDDEKANEQGDESNGDSGSEQEIEQNIEDYFPIYENVRMVYEGQGNEFAFFNVYIDYTSDGKVQQRIDNGGSQMVRVIEVRDDAIVETVSRGEVYYRENLLEAAGAEKILLREPLKKGTSWTLEDGSVCKITEIAAEVETPSGTYKAIEVTKESSNGTTIDYYAKDVGLVKTVFRSESGDIASLLSGIVPGEPFVQIVNFYFPNVEDESLLYYVSTEIEFRTNDVTRMVLQEAYKEAYKGEHEERISGVFTPNTVINSLYLNADGMVYIDLSRDYLTEMIAGAGFESAMLKCIANTFGQYYNAEKVLLTIDGELYTSGHIALDKGRYLEVNYEISKSIKD